MRMILAVYRMFLCPEADNTAADTQTVGNSGRWAGVCGGLATRGNRLEGERHWDLGGDGVGQRASQKYPHRQLSVCSLPSSLMFATSE